MNKFLLASILVAASSITVFSASESYAAETSKNAAQSQNTQDQAQKNDDVNQPKFLGKTHIMLAPGPVRLNPKYKSSNDRSKMTPEERYQDNLRMKSDLLYLKAGKKPETKEQKELAKFTPHDRDLILKRVNEGLSLSKNSGS